MRKNCKWTAAKDAVLKRLWAEGRMIKVIAAEVPCSIPAVKHRRAELGLPARYGIGGQHGDKKRVEFTLYLTSQMHAAVGRAAHMKGASVNAYIRSLISRDVSAPGMPRVTVIGQNGDRLVI